jgi:hypothetical protein
MFFRLGIALIIFGCILGYFTFREGQLASTASAKPEEISLKELIARGPQGNAHIILKDFVGFPEESVMETQNNNDNYFTKVWIPVVPREAAEAPGHAPRGGVKAIIKSNKVHSETEVVSLSHQPTVQGMVVNRIESLGSDERKELEKSPLGIDTARCLIIEHGRAPSGSSVLLLMGGGTIALLAGGAGLLVLSFKRR